MSGHQSQADLLFVSAPLSPTTPTIVVPTWATPATVADAPPTTAAPTAAATTAATIPTADAPADASPTAAPAPTGAAPAATAPPGAPPTAATPTGAAPSAGGPADAYAAPTRAAPAAAPTGAAPAASLGVCGNRCDTECDGSCDQDGNPAPLKQHKHASLSCFTGRGTLRGRSQSGRRGTPHPIGLPERMGWASQGSHIVVEGLLDKFALAHSAGDFAVNVTGYAYPRVSFAMAKRLIKQENPLLDCLPPQVHAREARRHHRRCAGCGLGDPAGDRAVPVPVNERWRLMARRRP
jgi:hypothetical protein